MNYNDTSETRVVIDELSQAVAVNRSKQSTDKASIISFFIYKATCSESNVSKQRT